MPISKSKLIWGAKLGVACTPVFGDLDKTQTLTLTNGWCDGVPIDAVILEVLECHRQATVIFTAVVRELDFEASKDAMARFA
jgi:hypothetical protein